MAVIRDLSLILLAVEAFVLALVPLVLLGGLAYATWWLRRHENLPRWLMLAQSYLTQGQNYVKVAMRAVAAPVLQVHSFLATVQHWFGAIARLGGKR
jgi:hypothetical protein